jgi:hypothetical protein
MITRLAAGRLIPKDPARVEISTHCTSVLVGSLNASTRSCLAFADVCPSSLCVAKNPKNHAYNYKQTFFDICYVQVQGLGWLHNLHPQRQKARKAMAMLFSTCTNLFPASNIHHYYAGVIGLPKKFR